MDHGRRTCLAVAAAGIGSAAGCLDLPFSEKCQFRRGGSIGTEEALIADTGISFDSAYPHQYHALITTQSEAKRVRWEYFREEDPVFAGKFEDTDFEEGFLTFAGLVLPKTKQLESSTKTFDGSTMESTYRVLDATIPANSRSKPSSNTGFGTRKRRVNSPSRTPTTRSRKTEIAVR